VPQTVLIVDDHASFRRMARRVLESDGLIVVGEAEDGASAISVVGTVDPDIVLLDVLLPDMDGFAVAEAIARAAARTRVVLTSSRELDDLRSRMTQTCAYGFLAKSDLSGDALIAIAAGVR
jgi:DNA-binding NarL/FixJ family response regulator